MLGIAVCTIKYLVALCDWSGISLHVVHACDAKIYIDDLGPWILGGLIPSCTIKLSEWWLSTRIIQAFDSVLQDKFKFLKRLSPFGTVRRIPQLPPAEQHNQIYILKRATAFVDTRDDIETKIGRFSRHLNPLMTEAGLWRDKFIISEYGLINLTAAAKAKLQSQLQDTERAHKEVLVELERMRETMERMEEKHAKLPRLKSRLSVHPLLWLSTLKSLTMETCHLVLASACQQRGLLVDVRGDPVTW
ncbi:hypothetical protein M405DRAFT_937549 [Rhizopogon salebrosus TDB-379]|nr:hypothetical protein M405DRAFT_937549 [Rhizopogon salebrosus TDB-379]